MRKISVYLRKDGRWESRVAMGVIDGKRQYKSFYGRTRQEAESKALTASCCIEAQVLTEMTVSELCAEWLQISRTRVKLSTLANYRMKVEKHIIPSFGGILCHELTSRSANIFVQNKLKSGLSPRYVSDIVVLLKSLFKYAKRTYRIQSPLEGIVLPKPARSGVRLLTAQEQERLKLYIGMNSSIISLGVVLANGMGLRIGEVCGLKWSDIDFEKRILTVRRTVQRVAVHDGINKTVVMIMPPKSETSVRDIPIPEGVFAMLSKYETSADNYVLSGCDSPIEPRKMQYHFAKILKNANLPSVRFHSLRHAFASKAVEVGFDIKTLSEILGHSKVELTMNLYVHSSMDRKRSCMELMK
ncbi:Site-specific recombinase XerD [Ruminococcaceae bacterium FB2012]|nr:Site-specific recombinase XerD [Ruminococcaceae bacterium FB2012]